MCKVALAKLLLIDMVIDINGFLPYITPQFLDEFARHASPAQMRCEPVPSAMQAEMILHPT
jgi:hypothetical protein